MQNLPTHRGHRITAVGIVLAGLAGAGTLASCSADRAESSNTERPSPTTVDAPAADPQPVETGDAGAMPDVVGMDLQQAQDHIQAVTELWYSDSRDATGQGREQLMDSNWVVVGQTPAAGSSLSEDDVPMLDVVKFGEVPS